jgi:hypothetical protein
MPIVTEEEWASVFGILCTGFNIHARIGDARKGGKGFRKNEARRAGSE